MVIEIPAKFFTIIIKDLFWCMIWQTENHNKTWIGGWEKLFPTAAAAISKYTFYITQYGPWSVDSFIQFPLYLVWPYDLFWFCTLPTKFCVRVMWQKILPDLVTHIYQTKNLTSCPPPCDRPGGILTCSSAHFRKKIVIDIVS